MNRFNIDKNIIIEEYTKAFLEYGPCPRGITWGSEASQIIRFDVMKGIGSLDGASILDFGCGMGDFYGYLEKYTKADLSKYVGIDINNILLQEARKRYPNANFLIRDILKNPFSENSFDFVLSSGAFAILTPNWNDFTFMNLDNLFSFCKKGMGINFLTSFSDSNTGSHYVNPCFMLEESCRRYSKKIVIRHDYKDNDFTIFVYKEK